MLYAPSADNSLWEYAVRRGWGDEEIRVISEPVLLVSAVRSGKVEIILCSGLNRLAHSSLELVELLREFVSRKITLIIPNQHIDTSKCPAKAFLDVLEAIEEFKHSAAAEAIHAGLNRARRRGVKLGRPETVSVHRENVARLDWPRHLKRAGRPEFECLQDHWPAQELMIMRSHYLGTNGS